MRIEITFLATCEVTLFTMKYSGIFWHESINDFFLIFGLIILSYTQRIAKIGLPKWKILALSGDYLGVTKIGMLTNEWEPLIFVTIM